MFFFYLALPIDRTVIETVTIFLAIHVVTMFVFLGFMWLLSGMTGLLWGYQKGRLPTLEEVLPYVRETTRSFFYLVF